MSGELYVAPFTLLSSVDLSADAANTYWRIDGYGLYLARMMGQFRERARRSQALERYYGGGLLLREVRDVR